MQSSNLDAFIPNPQASKIQRTHSHYQTKTRPTKTSRNSRNDLTSHPQPISQTCQKRFAENKESKNHSLFKGRSLCLLYIQELMRVWNFDIAAYSIMLEILMRLVFQGDQPTACKISLTIFHLVSKFCNARAPTISNLIYWSGYKVEVDDIVNYEKHMLQSLNYEIPLPKNCHMNHDELRALCFHYQTTIFRSNQSNQ